MSKIVILTGLQQEADTIPAGFATIFCGVTARDNLDSIVPLDTDGILCWEIWGGLSPTLSLGAVCVANSLVLKDNSIEQAPANWVVKLEELLGQANLFQLCETKTYSSDQEIAYNAKTRAQLALTTKAQAVEEGAYAVAAWATKNNKPWAAVGSISDTWDQTVSTWTNVVDNNGNVQVEQALQDILANPGQIPDVLKEAASEQVALTNLKKAAQLLAPLNWGFPQ